MDERCYDVVTRGAVRVERARRVLVPYGTLMCQATAGGRWPVL